MTVQAARDLLQTVLQETCLHKHKISLHHCGDVLVRHLHLVCWCKCKNEGLPHRCAAASPPGTGPAHSVGLPKSRLEVSRLPQAASLELTYLPNPSPSVRSLPKTSSSIHPAQLGESFMTARAMSVFCICSFPVMPTAHGESDLTPLGMEG